MRKRSRLSASIACHTSRRRHRRWPRRRKLSRRPSRCEKMGRPVDLGSGGRLSLEKVAQLLGRLQIARPADDGDRLEWTVAMVRASQSVTSAAAGWLHWSHT